MNGAHDLGGMHGLGPIDPEKDEPVFHAEWERRCFAITLATGFLGKWNIDMSRDARERMEPGEYLRTSYYEHWLHGLQTLLVEKGLISEEEITAREPVVRASTGTLEALRAADVEHALQNSRGARVDEDVRPRFAPGDAVLTRNVHPAGHTRLPRYARGRRGTVESDYGVFIFPDSHAAGEGMNPQHLYSVRFAAVELWGDAASARDAIYLDLWDDYLNPV